MSTATTTAHPIEDGALRWFQRLVWAGISGSVVVGIVSIAYPAQVLALAKVDPATPLVWPRLSAMLIMLLAGFYIPAALDANANRFAAVFAVVCRFAGTTFMAVVGGHYIIFGLFDFVFGAPRRVLYEGGGHTPPSTPPRAFRRPRWASGAWRSTAPSATRWAREWPPMPSRSSTSAPPPTPSTSRATCVSSRAARRTSASP